MSRTHAPRYLLALLIPAMIASARGQLPEPADSRGPGQTDRPLTSSLTPDGSAPADTIPLASARGYHFPREYPCLDAGAGLRTFNPDLSGLSGIYDGTPSFNLSPLFCIVIELACSNVISIQLDSGISLASSEYKAAQGIAGPIFYFHPFSNPDLRLWLGTGVAVCSFKGEESGLITGAGANGFCATAGLECPLGQSHALDVYGGYCSYPRVSGTYQQSKPSVDFSNVIVGLRLKWLTWGQSP